MSRRGWRENQKLLGASLLNFEQDVVLTIGKDILTRQEVATVLGHTHVGSIRKLDTFLNSGRGRFDSLKDAMRHITVEDIAERKGMGPTTMFAWMTLLEHFDRDPIKWLDWKGKGTLPTLQHRIRNPKKSKKQRTT